jgi:hypothetical protein
MCYLGGTKMDELVLTARPSTAVGQIRTYEIKNQNTEGQGFIIK